VKWVAGTATNELVFGKEHLGQRKGGITPTLRKYGNVREIKIAPLSSFGLA
jgi:hypothetical protein